ncbi:MAG: type IV pilus modification PilV family protein [Cyanobacterium sp.]
MKRFYHDKNLKKIKSQQGFTLLEATVSMLLLSFAILLNFPLLVVLQNENTTSKVRLGATSLARDLLDEVRSTRLIDPVNGEVNTGLSKLGYEYDATTYICTKEPDIDDQTFQVTNCSTTDDTENRHIVIQIKRNGQTEPIHTVQTFFTRVVPPPAAN